MTNENETITPATKLPVVHALPAPIVDVSTPDNWVIIVRPASSHFPSQEGKFGAEFWMANIIREGEEVDEETGDVFESSPDDPEAILRHHRDVTQGMVCGDQVETIAAVDGAGDATTIDTQPPIFFETVMAAADAAIKAARGQGANIDEHLEEYIQLLAREADTMNEGLPSWADVVFKRDALEAMKRVGCRDTKVDFIEKDNGRRSVEVSMIYRGEFYEVAYEPDFEHDQERQDVILQAIRDLPARAREAAAAAAPAE